jgi:hypothetical protein
MRWVLLAIGAMFLWSAVQNIVSARHRRLLSAVGGDRLSLLVMALVGVGATVSALYETPWPFYVAWLPMFAVAIRDRRRAVGQDLLPPPVQRMLAIPLNPMRMLRHPFSHVRQAWHIVAHPLRDRREMRVWYDEHKL